MVCYSYLKISVLQGQLFCYVGKADDITVLTGKIFARKSSYDSDSSSLTVSASDKVLVPGSQSDGPSSSTDQLDAPGTEEPEVLILVIQINRCDG